MLSFSKRILGSLVYHSDKTLNSNLLFRKSHVKLYTQASLAGFKVVFVSTEFFFSFFRETLAIGHMYLPAKTERQKARNQSQGWGGWIAMLHSPFSSQYLGHIHTCTRYEFKSLGPEPEPQQTMWESSSVTIMPSPGPISTSF